MRVKIKDVWYNSARQPLMISLSPEEREIIISNNITEFCAFPEGTAEETIKAFMGAVQNKSFKVHEV